MPKGQKTTKTARKIHHLSPLEVESIKNARLAGARVNDLADQYGVSRQTIYVATRETPKNGINKDGTKANQDDVVIPKKRRRSRRIPAEIRDGIIAMKIKYPKWGVAYLREQWVKAGNPPVSPASIYRILHGAGLQTRELVEKEVYQRFEMTRPGQLWQMDIEGQIYIPGIGTIHGFAILDDFSRYCPGYQYFSDMTLSKGILLLHKAIGIHGVPNTLYVDNGKQFASSGERLNNFELFCAAHSMAITHTLPGRPEGKGKIERFYKTVEEQFITWVQAKVKDLGEGETYTLDQLNADLQAYLQEEYHARIHGSTNETPAARFFSESLRAPSPSVKVEKFLERSITHKVNKYGEISHNGYKIQVALPGKTHVILVETLETFRIEHDDRLIREVNKRELSKEAPVKRQSENRPHAKEKKPSLKERRNPSQDCTAFRNTPDENGFLHRMTNSNGELYWKRARYRLGPEHEFKEVLFKIEEDRLIVRTTKGVLIKKFKNKSSRKISNKMQGVDKVNKDAVIRDKKAAKRPVEIKPDEQGFYHRRSQDNGRFELLTKRYHAGKNHASLDLLIKIVDNELHVFDEQMNLLKICPIKNGQDTPENDTSEG